MIYGREPKIPLDLTHERVEVDLFLPPNSYAEQVREALKQAYENVAKTRDVKMDKVKLRHDRKVRAADYKKGDRVWLLDTTTETGKSKKLSRQWKGPYVIEEVIGPVNYCIRSTAPNSRPSVVHKNRLKMCYSSKIAEEEPTEESAENVPAAVTVDKPATKAAPTVKRGRGRPKKASATIQTTQEVTEPTITAKRKRGRPRKITVPQAEIETHIAASERIKEFVPELEAIEELEELEQPKVSAEIVPCYEPAQYHVESQPQPIIKRKRGRPKKSAQANKPPEQAMLTDNAEEMRLRPRKQVNYTE